MAQAGRDRLVRLKKAKKKLISQQAAADENGGKDSAGAAVAEQLQVRGDKGGWSTVLRGQRSNRKIEEKTEREAVKILSAPVYVGFGPTLAWEYLASKHGIEVSKEAVRQWMIRSELWRREQVKGKKAHTWRPRRSRLGELVQRNTRA